jgi:hypothetical protein
MKNFKYIILFLIFCCSNACNKFEDINIDPNSPTKVPSDYLLTSAQKSISVTMSSALGLYFSTTVAQYWSQNNYTDESRWRYRGNAINDGFSSLYTDGLYELQQIIELESKEGAKVGANNRIAIARIMKAWMYQNMTDIWGPIPYTEALQGDKIRTPKYDDQKTIYLGLLKELNEAITQINASQPSFIAKNDVVYGGDMAHWKAFANALIMRIAMRMSDVEPVLAKSEFEKSAASAFTSNTDNAYFTFLSNQPNNNPIHQNRIERGDADYCLSNVLIDNTLKPLNDPRLEVFCDPKTNGGGYFGRPFGQSSGDAAGESPDDYSQPSGAAAVAGFVDFKAHDVLNPEAPFTLMNYAEVCFLMAEAKERGWATSGTAQDWYNKGITASLNEWGVLDATKITTYLAQKTVDYKMQTTSWKQKIGVQKWLALFMQGIQGWSEWRRLDFDKPIVPVGGSLSDVGLFKSPMRLIYPSEEQTKNGANYDAAVKLLGAPDNLKTKLWWDKN